MVFSVNGNDRAGHRYQTSHINSHKNGGLYSANPRSPQYALPRGVKGYIIPNINQGCCLYTHQNHPYYPYISMLPHPHPRMPPHPIFMCPYWTSSPIYKPYGIAHHPHITPFGYLYCPSPSFLPYPCLQTYFLLICFLIHQGLWLNIGGIGVINTQI